MSPLTVQSLDTDSTLPDHPPSVVSSTLIHLLASLSTSLVPDNLQQQCCEAEDRDEGYAILEGVEGVHTNVCVWAHHEMC
jgi:hypothetical protein